MSIAIMQPYFLPYIGYWQLMDSVDQFVLYDNIQFTKNSWIRRNRYLVNNNDALFTLPIKKDSDYLHVRDRLIFDSFYLERNKILNRLKSSYRKAPFFNNAFPIIEKCFLYEEENLFKFIEHSIKVICDYLDITTPIIISSNVNINHSLTKSDKVIAICKALLQDTYINPIGGLELYSKEEFNEQGIKLSFHQTKHYIYKQFDHNFVPNLSIIDVMMFNSNQDIKRMLKEYELV